MGQQTGSRACRRAVVLAAAVVAAGFSQRAGAATKTWANTSGNWSAGTNWSGGVKPLAGDFAVLARTGSLVCTYDITASPFNVGSILIDGSMTLAQGSVANTQLNPGSMIIGSTGLEPTSSTSAGIYTLSTGALNVTNQIILGQDTGSSGTIAFSNGTITAGSENIGTGGAGTMTQSGGFNSSASINVGTSSGSGFYSFSGGVISGSTLNINSTGTFVTSGVGSIDGTSSVFLGGGTISGILTNFGTFTSNSGTLIAPTGGALGNSGTFIYNGGDNSAWRFTDTGTFIINNNWTATALTNQSTHSINIPAATTVNLISTAANDRALSDDGTINLNGGTLNVLGAAVLEAVGDIGLGTFNQAGGTNNAANLAVGNGSNSIGNYILQSGTLSTTTTEQIGVEGAATLTQGNATHTSSGIMEIGVGSLGHGTLSITDGTLSAPGAGTRIYIGFQGAGVVTQSAGLVTTGGILLGFEPGASGSYFLSGGTLSATTEIISDDANTCSFQQTGGVNNAFSLNMAASGASSHATYTLASGSLSTTVEAIGTTGAATFTQLGGANTASNVISIGNAAGGAGTYLLSGGTFTAPLVELNPNAQLIQTGGVLDAGSIDFQGFASRYSFQAGLFHLTNGTLSIADAGLLGSNITTATNRSITVDGVADLTQLGVVTVNGGTFSIATLLNDGGSIQLNTGTLQINSPAIHIGANQPLGATVALNLGANLIAGGTNSLSIDGLAVLDLRGGMVSSNAGMTNNGQIFMESPDSFVTGNGSLVNNGLINGSGRILDPLFNNGEVRADSGDDLQFFGFGNVITNTGKFTLNGGRIEFSQDLTNGGAGVISGRGTLATTLGFSNNGSVVFSGAGNTDVFGPVTNFNRINVTGGNTTTFWNTVTTTSGTINVNTNSTVVFAGALTGQSHITGPGTKDFESTASGGAIATVVGNTLVGSPGAVNADFVRENDVQIFGALSVKPNGGASAVNTMNTLSISGGTLDLADNDLIVRNTPLATIAGYIQAAYNHGAWNGAGLASGSALAAAGSSHKTALGYATAASLGISIFDGQPVSGSNALVRYTLAGDSNLDGIVNAQDFDALASHYGTLINGIWTTGDYNYDGVTNTADFNALAANFNAALAAPGLGTLVPEPSAAIAAIMLLTSVGLRRRQRIRLDVN